jgi:hypothetical protein
VTLDGRPLEGASVTLEPESFLGEEVKVAVCTTDMFGTASPNVPDDQRLDPRTSGAYMGFYKVKISKLANGKEMVPRKYNEESILGQEVARDVPDIANNRLRYVLTTN